VTITASQYPLHGVDISVFQPTWLVPQMIDFAIVRATFGSKRDKRTVEHVEAIRKRTACAIGLYHFFVHGQDTVAQLGAFFDSVQECRVGTGDLIPWVDVESPKGDGSMPPKPAWCDQLHELIDGIAAGCGGRCGIYITQRDWALLGKPDWMLELPLWVAHWRSTPGPPASPGGVPPVLWQYRVGPWARGGLHTGQHAAPKAIDHDCCVAAELPRIVAPDEPVPDTVRPPEIPWLGLDDDDWEAMRAERDRAVTGDDS